jgi:dienelactone hydrolase
MLNRKDKLNLNRRELFQAAGLGLLAPTGWSRAHPTPAQEQVRPERMEPLNRFPRMVQEYMVERVGEVELAGLRLKSTMKTKADAEAYVLAVRQKIRGCFGPFPERTPLNPRIVGVVERDSYNVEKVIFESRPDFLVTANLYVPKGRKFPLPGVVATCGHSSNGKAYESYQSFTQGLARMGYIVLIFDPIGQGERLQYTDANLPAELRDCLGEHLQAGNQQVLVGEVFAGWRAWDGIRALDYLLTRPEVDRRHLGVTGNSGGSTMTTWLCGLDHRWTMAAPSCFVTTFRRNLENEIPADPEQYPNRALALGLDMDDFLAAMAPRPVLILGKEKDFFDVRGTEEAYRRLERLYTLLGATDNIGLFIGPTYHGFTRENREAMYRWFNRATGISDAQSEPALAIEKDETLQCTSRGQVADLGSRTVFSFTQEKSKALAAGRPPLAGEALRRAVSEALKLPTRAGIPEFRILRPAGGRRYPKPHAAVYAVETEPGIHALVYLLSDEPLLSRPPRGTKGATLYISHQSSDAELRDEPMIRELLKGESPPPLFTCDVRGIGESQPNTCEMDSFLNIYGSDYFYAGHSIMLDRPYVGQKTYDILQVLDWMESYGCTEIHLAGKGWGAIPAAFAALISNHVSRVTLKNAPASFSAIAESEDYRWPLSTLLPGVLKSFDLPDCYRALAVKQLCLVDPWGAMAGPV